MADVKTLLNRTVESLKAHGYDPHIVEHSFIKGHPSKTFHVYQTFRMNHSDQENVTVTIEITRWNLETGIGKIVAKVKVPKDASERVLENRVTKAIKAYEEA